MRWWALSSEVGEGPLWDWRSRRVISTDLLRGHILQTIPETGQTATCAVPGPVGAVGLVAQDGEPVPDVYVIAHADRVSLLHFPSGALETLVTLPEITGALRWNDGKIDPRGRLVAGTMTDSMEPGVAALFVIEPGDSGYHVVPLLRGITASNGLDWSPEGDVLYYVDSATQQVVAYPYPIPGTDTRPRSVSTFPSELGIPDGLCGDEAGNIWVAVWGSSHVYCLTPDGDIEDEVRLPVTNVSSCAFGSAEMTSLFVTSAYYNLSAEQRSEQPLAGALFEAVPGARGRPATPFDVADDNSLRRLLAKAEASGDQRTRAR